MMLPVDPLHSLMGLPPDPQDGPPASPAPTTALPEDAAALLDRAADRLAELDAAAGDAPWQVDDEDDSELRLVRGTALNVSGSYWCTDEIATHDTDSYGDSDDTYRDDPEYREVRADFDLIAALRPVAAPLAAWLREAAQTHRSAVAGFGPSMAGQPDAALAVARAVLGETDGGEPR